MPIGSPFRPPHDGEPERVAGEMRFSARALNAFRSIEEYLRIDELRDFIRNRVVLLERGVAGEGEGKRTYLRDPTIGEFEVLKL